MTLFASFRKALRVPKRVGASQKHPFGFRTETKTYLEISQQPDVGCDLMCRCTEARQRCQDINVDFPGIRLGCDGVGIPEPTKFGDAFVQCLYFCMVAIKEGQETGLSTRRSLCTTETEVVSCPFEVP